MGWGWGWGLRVQGTGCQEGGLFWGHEEVPKGVREGPVGRPEAGREDGMLRAEGRERGCTQRGWVWTW